MFFATKSKGRSSFVGVVWSFGRAVAIGALILACDNLTTPTEPLLRTGGSPASVCPEPPCAPPVSEQEQRLWEAVYHIAYIGASYGDDVCIEVAEAAAEALYDGNIWMGDYVGVTYWIGNHPNDAYDFTEIGQDILQWPPLQAEFVLAHEFIHASQHVHGQETWVDSKANQCVFGG